MVDAADKLRTREEKDLCDFLSQWNGVTAFLMRKAMEELPDGNLVKEKIVKHLAARSERLAELGAA